MINDAVILLAGFGSRLSPLTDNQHKTLIQIGNKCILERQLEALTAQGIEHFHMVLGHRADDLRHYLKTHFSHLDITYYENPIYNRTNTGYSLSLVIQSLHKGFWLLDGDVVFEPQLLNLFKNNTDRNVLLCETDPAKLDAEAVKFRVNEKNEIVEIGKEINLSDARGESIGVAQFQSDFIVQLNQVFQQQFQNSAHANWYYEDAFHWMIQNKIPFSPLLVQSTEHYNWVEVDDFADLENAQIKFGTNHQN